MTLCHTFQCPVPKLQNLEDKDTLASSGNFALYFGGVGVGFRVLRASHLLRCELETR